MLPSSGFSVAHWGFTVLVLFNLLKHVHPKYVDVICSCPFDNFMFAIFQVNKTLKELHLMKYDMRDFGVTRLAEHLVDNFSLTYLNLSW